MLLISVDKHFTLIIMPCSTIVGASPHEKRIGFEMAIYSSDEKMSVYWPHLFFSF